MNDGARGHGHDNAAHDRDGHGDDVRDHDRRVHDRAFQISSRLWPLQARVDRFLLPGGPRLSPPL